MPDIASQFRSASLNNRELMYKALAGLAGGAIGWLPVEIASHGHNLTEQLSTGEIVASYVSMCLLAGLIGGSIVASDQQSFEFNSRARGKFVRGFLICAAIELFANYWANEIFTAILNYGGWGVGQQGSVFYLVIARMTSWTLMGAMLGAGVGIASFNPKNILKGAIGGWIGGFLGGIAFDLINSITGGGLASRLIGLSLIGFAIGLLIGLVQELTKSAWITVEAGRVKGRQYRIEGAVASIGRAEENPIGLFGDSAVQARHAVIERRGDDYILKGLAVAEGTELNGKRIETATLHDGDTIQIGSYQLGFHLRQGPAAQVGSAPRAYASASPAFAAGAASANGGPALIDATGNRIPVASARPTTLGRALDNDIVVNHASVSRHHAAIESNNGSFRLRDLGSQNGTFVGGNRVSETPLRDGDAVRLGDAAFTFRA